MADAGAANRADIFYFEARGLEYLEATESDKYAPASTERLLVYVTYRRRRCPTGVHKVEDARVAPGLARVEAHNNAVDLLSAALVNSSGLKVLNQKEAQGGADAHVANTCLDGDLRSGGPWQWEMYDVDVLPSTYRYGPRPRVKGHGIAALDAEKLPFEITADDAELLEQWQSLADANAYDGAGYDWFGAADDAIVILVASAEKRDATAVRILRKIEPNAFNRTALGNHDPVERPLRELGLEGLSPNPYHQEVVAVTA
jgi:hypothetical protein